MSKPQVTLFWFRRDFRLEDNRGLYHALQEETPVQPVFIFDTNILDELPRKDARVEFIHQEITRLQSELKVKGASMDVRIGKPMEVWKQLTEAYDIQVVWANRDYEPYARERDKEVHDFFKEKGVEFKAKKDHVILKKMRLLKVMVILMWSILPTVDYGKKH